MKEVWKRTLLSLAIGTGLVGSTILIWQLLEKQGFSAFPPFWIVGGGIFAAALADSLIRLTFVRRLRQLEAEYGYDARRGAGYLLFLLFDLLLMVFVAVAMFSIR